MLRDQRDRERREARAAAVARGEVEQTPQAISSSIGDMPGTGQSLMPLQPDVSMDRPPAYDDSEDEMRI
jgi:hypothetical protein